MQMQCQKFILLKMSLSYYKAHQTLIHFTRHPTTLTLFLATNMMDAAFDASPPK